MKKLFLILFVFLSMGDISFAHKTNDQVQDTKKNDDQVQNTEAAFKYFENELNFTAGPGTVRKVSEGKVDGIIVDLRRKEHFDKGHIPGAINIPFDQYSSFEGQQTEFKGLSKDKINYLYCYELLCNLSQKAAKKFASLG